MALLDIMKRIAQQSNDASVPMAIMFGTVTAVGPLKILVDNRFYIDEDMVIVPRELRGGEEYSTHYHIINSYNTEPAGEVPHIHAIPAQQTDKEIYYGLAVGDKVILLRNYGGQEYLVIGRV